MFHLFYTKRNTINNFNTIFFRYADEVSNGDEVLVNKNDKLSPTKVISVSNTMMQGKYQLNLFFNNFQPKG